MLIPLTHLRLFASPCAIDLENSFFFPEVERIDGDHRGYPLCITRQLMQLFDFVCTESRCEVREV